MTDDIKLPWWFKIDTPIGTYNPEWAKIQCGKAHFDTPGVDFAHIASANDIG